MKIISYSDLHLEFGTRFQPPLDSDADLMVLAGDIVTFRDFSPLDRLLRDWQKPVLCVAGNHEYYTGQPMNVGEDAFRAWLSRHHPQVTLLRDQAVAIDGVQFFGGTMWTDFVGANPTAMRVAQQQMNDYRLIVRPDGKRLRPADTVQLHRQFVGKLLDWFQTELPGPRVVISHTAPAINPDTRFAGSPLMPAFNSLDMLAVIEAHQPALWIYGHTHECDDQAIGRTRIISNQLGYPDGRGDFECSGFKRRGCPVDL